MIYCKKCHFVMHMRKETGIEPQNGICGDCIYDDAFDLQKIILEKEGFKLKSTIVAIALSLIFLYGYLFVW